MRWNSKTDIIALLIAGGGFALVGLVVGVVAPTIVNIRQGGIWGFWPIPVSVIVICCLVYILRHKTHKKTKDN